MDSYCPHEAAARLGATIITTRLDHAYGYADGTRTIWLDDRLTPTEVRCVLTHEIFHVIHGHVGQQPPHVEAQIHAATARWLIPWPHLLAVLRAQADLYDMAETLGVTPTVVHHRLTYATPTELDTLKGTPHAVQPPDHPVHVPHRRRRRVDRHPHLAPVPVTTTP